ncbi:uncharacterized protein LOC117122965, partial [Anneissia japonica]|uniref:uncharacterized protein LOC117122965 n=1 Tax=Anneissia japonica TaxID=1529436 RepID=UPI0014256C23
PFYLCQTNQNVFTTSKTIKVRWLEVKKAPDIYMLVYNDTIELASVLTEVKLTKKDKDSYSISAKEIKRIEKIIELAIKKENGELNENDVLSPDLLPDDDEEEEEEEKKTATKRGKKKVVAVKKAGKGRKRAGSRAAVKPKPKASASLISNRLKNKAKRKLTTQKQTNKKSKPTKAKAKKPVKKKLKKVEKKVKEKKGKQPRKHPNQLLTPNTKIEIVMKDPCFEIKAENEMPEVSKAAYAKRAIRAVLTNDMVLLRKLINDKKKVASVFLDRSVDVKDDAMSYAIMNNNQAAIKLLGTELEANQRDRCRIPDSILETQGTGT